MERRAPLLVLIVLGLATICGAASVEQMGPGEMRITITSDVSRFRFEEIDGYDYVRGPDAVYRPEPGVPSLPMEPYHITIPWDMRVTGVTAQCLSQTAVAGDWRIVPTQPPTILGENQPQWVNGRTDIYMTDDLYPLELIGGVHQGFMGDNRILSFNFSPFRWNPVTGDLIFCDRLEVSVRLEHTQVRRPFRPRSNQANAFSDALHRMVANPEHLEVFSPRTHMHAVLGASMLPEGDYEYVIITADSLAAYFQPLVDWKNEKGVPTTIVTREWIEANYSGANTQEMMRNFIIDAYQTWGIIWVLMGADTAIIPSRTVYAMDCEMGGPPGNRIRCDLYFGDLDGDWNANGDGVYGEVADSVDMYPDVFVGRAPAENIAETVVFVDKVLTYEKDPPSDYALEMLMAGEVMWTNPYTDGGVGLNMIDEDCIPPRFDPILKLYESLGNESAASVLAAMSAGQNFVIHDGHCNEYVMGAGDGYIYYTDADTLSNGDRTLIINSIGCWPAAIDKDCVAEHFMNNPNGGCVAFIGNSRYGWGSPGNPGFGYSDKFQYQFYWSVFADKSYHIGQAHAESKAKFVEFARDENVYRWCEYQLNLLGDPEMPVWTNEPAGLVVTVPDSIMASGDVVRVVVEDADGAVPNALVCVCNDTDVYKKGRTDASGAITLSVSTISPDSLLITVSAYDHVPLQQKVPVVTQGTLLAWTEMTVDDGGDGKVNPGETVDLNVLIKNYGTMPDSGVWGVLRHSGGFCTVADSTVYYGDVGAGQEVTGGDGFSVEFDGGLANSDVVVFDLVLLDSVSGEWAAKLPVTVAAPVLYVASYGIDDRLGGDGDWVVEPGETVLLTLEVANTGLTYGSASAYVTSLDASLAAEDSATYMGPIDAGSSGYSLHKVTVSGMCPATHLGRLGVSMSCTEGYGFSDTAYFTVGDLCFTDDCESGEGVWTHSGSPDLWHQTSYRSHSDSVSWYFGQDGTHTYPCGADGSVISQDFIAGENNRLAFWFWYDFTTYGSDGVYVIVHTDGVPDTLDFLGSGGALDPANGALNIVSSWTKWERLLSDVTPSDTVTLEFGFMSDGVDVAEGMYIDDISFTCTTPVITGIDDIVDWGQILTMRTFPNPVRTVSTIMFAGQAGRLLVDIYTVEGRLAACLEKPMGQRSVFWDLTDRTGRKVAPGIYLAKVRGRSEAYSSKIVVVR